MKNQRPANTPIPESILKSQLRLATTALCQVISAVFGENRPADRALSGYFRENKHCGSRDRQFISETVFAVFRNWGILRYILDPERLQDILDGEVGASSRELERLIFGAAFLERLDFPALKVLTRQLHMNKLESCGSYVGRCRALWKAFGEEREFSVNDQFPEWISKYVAEDFPLEYYAKQLTCRPPMWIRMQCENPNSVISKLVALDLHAEIHDRIHSAVAIRNARVNLFSLDEFRKGAFEVQDLASQCIGLVAAPKSGERWLDCCAGAGGKSLQLADIMKRKGTVVASDIRGYKLDDLRKRARRAAFPNIMTKEWDGKPFSPKQATFDGVLVDAPCSCSGVWRRNPDGCWTLKEEEIAEMATLQGSILEAGSTAVRAGGVLVYATCSIFPQENFEVVEKFLAEHSDFAIEAFENPLSGEMVESGMLAIYPDAADSDAMFVARMRKK